MVNLIGYYSFTIFERKDRENKKLAVWRFHSLFLSVQYDDWKYNEKKEQQKQYSCRNKHAQFKNKSESSATSAFRRT